MPLLVTLDNNFEGEITLWIGIEHVMCHVYEIINTFFVQIIIHVYIISWSELSEKLKSYIKIWNRPSGSKIIGQKHAKCCCEQYLKEEFDLLKIYCHFRVSQVTFSKMPTSFLKRKKKIPVK